MIFQPEQQPSSNAIYKNGKTSSRLSGVTVSNLEIKKMWTKSFFNLCLLFSLTFCAGGIASFAQKTTERDDKQISKTGTISGEISITKKSGNDAGKIGCGYLRVSAGTLPPGKLLRTAIASGDISTKKCLFEIKNFPANETFVLTLGEAKPFPCDEKKLRANVSFPMSIKIGEKAVYNFLVTELRCVNIK